MLQTLRSVFADPVCPYSYGWIIDRDYTQRALTPGRTEGVRGPRGICDDIAAELSSRRRGRPFRLYRGETLIFTGRLLTRDGKGISAPLSEFGQAYGCTRIVYDD